MGTMNFLCCKIQHITLCKIIGWLGLTINGGFTALFTYFIVALFHATSTTASVAILVLYSIFLVAVLLHFIASIFVILSTNTKIRYFLLPWIIITLVDVILLVVGATHGMVFGLVMLLPLILAQICVIRYYGELMDHNRQTV